MKFQIHLIAKDDDFKITDQYIEQIYKDDSSLIDEVKIIKHSNNSLALPVIYNKILDEVRSNNSVDMLAFMHADVKLDLIHFIKHLKEVNDKYDAIGLCGCDRISVGQKPLNWFCGSRPYPDHRWGCVTHGELSDQMSFFGQHHPDVTDHPVSCIDGLCIVLNKKIIENKDFKFDESYKFNHYDTDFSFECVMKYHYKLGVILEKSLYHYSVGKGILSKEFLDEEEIFRKKWNI